MQTSEIIRRIRNFKRRFGATHRAAPAVLLGDEKDRSPGRYYDVVRDVSIHNCEDCGEPQILDTVEVMRGVDDNIMETVCTMAKVLDLSEEDAQVLEGDGRILVELFESLDQVEKLLCDKG